MKIITRKGKGRPGPSKQNNGLAPLPVAAAKPTGPRWPIRTEAQA
jgi:hypothetical protein